jgi:hypothetical protein
MGHSFVVDCNEDVEEVAEEEDDILLWSHRLLLNLCQ